MVLRLQWVDLDGAAKRGLGSLDPASVEERRSPVPLNRVGSGIESGGRLQERQRECRLPRRVHDTPQQLKGGRVLWVALERELTERLRLLDFPALPVSASLGDEAADLLIGHIHTKRR